MPPDHRRELADIKRFDQLVAYLRDEMDWPIEGDSFEDLTFEYTPEELGIDAANAAKIQAIKRLRPLSANQPWGIFFVKFEPKRLPVVALRLILSRVVLKKRAAANSAERAAWQMADLLFISNYGDKDERRIAFAHFVQDDDIGDRPTLKVLGWDGDDTNLHLDHVAQQLKSKLRWPDGDSDDEAWRSTWAAAFTLRHREVITTSKHLAERLANLARATRKNVLDTLAIETPNGPWRKLMESFKKALIHDLDDDGFADMYAQTIAYGLLSARISRPAGLVADNIADLIPVTNPFLKEMLENFLRLGGRRRSAQSSTGIDFDELGINEMVQRLRKANMEAVVRDFGDRNPREDPVIHFYEYFLKEYDAKKRMQRGVFYTPRPVVSYIVRSVDELLRTEFGLEDGLADTTTWGEMVEHHRGLKIPEGGLPDQAFVQILDPATGTGTFLVEVIDLIHRTMVAKWKTEGHQDKKIEVLWNDYVPKHLLPRLHGYELMMAPYAIAHLKIGLKLSETRYRFGSEKRAGIYLTNALEPATDSAKQMEFKELIPALAHEAQEVNEIKRKQRFTVVIGNPPYAKSQTENTWIAELVRTYREGLEERKSDTNREEWKFIRYATHEISKATCGIASYVVNNSFLEAPTLRRMRAHLLDEFNQLYVLNLHGDSNKREVTPDGSHDFNVFEIKQGVCVAAMSRRPQRARENHLSVLHYGDVWGRQDSKYETLDNNVISGSCDQTITPDSSWQIFIPRDKSTEDEYGDAVSIASIWRSVCGIETKRDHFAMDFDQRQLEERIEAFASAGSPESELKTRFNVRDNDWIVMEAQRRLKDGKHWRDAIVPCVYRPFDSRWILYLDYVLARDRGPLMAGMNHPNFGLVVPRQTKEDFGALVIDQVCTHKIVTVYDRSFLFPLYSYHESSLEESIARDCLVDRKFLRRFAESLGLSLIDNGGAEDLTIAMGPDDFFHYVYA